MDFNKLTIKSGEAVAAAQELARRAGNPELTRDHLTVALLEQELPRTLLQRAGADPGSVLAEAEARVRALPPKQRAALTLRYAGDLTHAEVARALGCSEEAARRSAHEGLKTLRLELVP